MDMKSEAQLKGTTGVKTECANTLRAKIRSHMKSGSRVKTAAG